LDGALLARKVYEASGMYYISGRSMLLLLLLLFFFLPYRGVETENAACNHLAAAEPPADTSD
jgi:hypothetical protein